MPQKSILQLKKKREQSPFSIVIILQYQRSNYDLVEDNFILIIE